MTPDMVLDIMQRAIWYAVEAAAPLIAVGTGVGLLMGLVQAATQISEPALTFVPKIAALAAGAIFFGNAILERLATMGREMFTAIGTLP